MRRYSAVLLVCLALLGFSAAIEGGRKAMSVQVKQVQVRATPSFLGKVVATLAYGDRVETLEEKDGWIRIVPPGSKAPGWIHSSALTEKRVVLMAGKKETDVAASTGELALAGRGFNADVEAAFKAGNRDIDFTWIDRMQNMNVPPGKIQAFVQEGKLIPAEGGGR
ncbi:MAG TPA: SH3 domain-containing protein [Acidobacteriota bacterium]|nr:SH3 domain-containing protein [Acidobacteriota bacterium]